MIDGARYLQKVAGDPAIITAMVLVVHHWQSTQCTSDLRTREREDDGAIPLPEALRLTPAIVVELEQPVEGSVVGSRITTRQVWGKERENLQGRY